MTQSVSSGIEQRRDPRTIAQIGDRPLLSVVVPMRDEEEVLGILFQRLRDALEKIGETYEIICINDGSRDRTSQLLLEAHEQDPRIKVINFSRNFGKEAALTAGLDYATGQTVVPIDADLQDPPELIADFLEKWRDGYDVVFAVRKDRGTDSWIKRRSAAWFYRVINRLARIKIPHNAGDFRLMDRRVVDAMHRMRERNRFMKGLFAWVGFSHTQVTYDRPERAAGKTKFNYWKLWNFALDGITAYSTFPLRLAGYVGVIAACLSLFYGAWLALRTIIWGIDVPGYASVMVAVLFMGGVQLVVLGVIGEYIGRVFEETKHRPLYIAESTLGLDTNAPD